MDKKRFLIGAIMVFTLVVTSRVTMASVGEERYKLLTDGQEKEQSLILSNIDKRNLVPLRLTLGEIGATNLKWEPSTSEWLKGKITLTLESYFTSDELRNLKRAFLTENPYWNTKLPEAVTTLLEPERESGLKIEDSILNQKRGIEIEINSDGYTTGYMFYHYEIMNDKIYVPYSFFKNLGIEGITIDHENKEVIINTHVKEKFQKEIDTIWQALHTPDSKELLGLWIHGQQYRSGALQYATLSKDLKEKVLPEIKERGWVTGGSSPTLRGGKVTILNKQEISEQEVNYTVEYESMLQGKVYETLQQIITMKKITENDKSYWEITDVQGDVGYYTYEIISTN